MTAQITAERKEKQQVLDILQTEQEKNRLLMLPKLRRTLSGILSNLFRNLTPETTEQTRHANDTMISEIRNARYNAVY